MKVKKTAPQPYSIATGEAPSKMSVSSMVIDVMVAELLAAA